MARLDFTAATVLALALSLQPAAAPAAERAQDGQARPRFNSELPPDVRQNIRNYLRGALPPMWWYEDPQPTSLGYRVVIHVPDNWRGAPGSALMNICPQPSDPVWLKLRQIELQAKQNAVSGAVVTCRQR